MNITTRRHPRSLQEAFGPHTSNELHPMPDTPGDRVVEILCRCIGVAALLLLAWACLALPQTVAR